MNKSQAWYFSGIGAFSLAVGLLTGASQSPVVGVVVTSVFGVLAALVGLLSYSMNRDSHPVLPNIETVGQSLLLFAVCVVLGAWLGGVFRVHLIESKTGRKEFIWSQSNAPESVPEALDWIRVEESLRLRGFTPKQIRSIYNMRARHYDKRQPYYKILSGEAINDSSIDRSPPQYEVPNQLNFPDPFSK